MIRFYQKGISPFTRPSCRFVPTCSAYAHEAIDRYGLARGGWLFLKRFARCHPFGGKGYDPVPVPQSPDSSRGPHPSRASHPPQAPHTLRSPHSSTTPPESGEPDPPEAHA